MRKLHIDYDNAIENTITTIILMTITKLQLMRQQPQQNWRIILLEK